MSHLDFDDLSPTPARFLTGRLISSRVVSLGDGKMYREEIRESLSTGHRLKCLFPLPTEAKKPRGFLDVAEGGW